MNLVYFITGMVFIILIQPILEIAARSISAKAELYVAKTLAAQKELYKNNNIDGENEKVNIIGFHTKEEEE